MSIFNRLGLKSKAQSFILNTGIKSTDSRPMSVKSDSLTPRIPFEYLENIYLTHPVAYNGINKMVQMMMNAGYTLYGDDKSVNFFNNFLDNLGKVGEGRDKDELIESILTFLGVYGRAPMELIHGKKTKEIIDLDLIDPKSFDYARNSSGQILLDSQSNSVGYIQTVPNFYQVPAQKIEPPQEVMERGNNQIFFPPERIALFKLNTIGDGFESIGLIEPAYKTYINHLSAEEGFANACFRIGNPLIVARVGDKEKPPTEQHILDATKQLEDITSRAAYAHGPYDELKILEPKHSEKMTYPLKYFIQNEAAAMGLITSFVAGGTSEGSSQKTVARQEYLMKLGFNEILNKVSRIFETKIFKRIADSHNAVSNNKINPVKMKFGEVSLEELDAKCTRITKYTKAGLIQPSASLREYISDTENLPKS